MSYRRHSVRFGIGLLWLTPVAVLTPFILETPVCAPFVALSIRTMRIGVFTSDAGVIVRGALRTWRLMDALNEELAARRGSRSGGRGSARSAA